MNKRIQELALQAKVESSQWMGCKTATTITYDELEKFAQLIVQECILVLGSNELWNRDISATLNKHFGVER